MNWKDYLIYDDYAPLLPPYKGFRKDQIKIIEFFKRREIKNADPPILIFERHDPIGWYEYYKAIKIFRK